MCQPRKARIEGDADHDADSSAASDLSSPAPHSRRRTSSSTHQQSRQHHRHHQHGSSGTASGTSNAHVTRAYPHHALLLIPFVFLGFVAYLVQSYFMGDATAGAGITGAAAAANAAAIPISLPSPNTNRQVNALQRGKHISAQVTAKELYEAYREIKEEYKAKAMSRDFASKWDILKATPDDIEISMLQHPSDASCPYVRMKAVMPGTIQDVWEFLELDQWQETMPKMDPFYEGLSILGKYSYRPAPTRPAVSMVLAKKRTKRIAMYAKRDFTFVSVSDTPTSDGTYVSGTVSVITSKLPRERGYVRAFQDSVAFYKALPDDADTGEPRTLLTIVCRIDLNDSAEGGEGGNIPMYFYKKTIGTSGWISMNSMRSEIRKRIDSRLLTRDMRTVGSKRRKLDEASCPLIPWVGIAGT